MTDSTGAKSTAGTLTSGEASDDGASSSLDEDSSGLLSSREEAFLRAATATSKQGPPSEDPDRTGTLLDKYKIVAEIGRGGMGIVYSAEDQKLRRRVALKVLPAKFAGHPERRQRFLREARATSAIAHGNVATVFDVDEADDGSVYIAMELVEGSTLRSLLREGPLDVAEAVRIGREVLLGLSKAHEVGIIHRDLKPDNVMVLSDGSVKLLDFGLAKPVGTEEPALEEGETDHSDVVTMEGRVVGTPSYMSPEQAKGEPVDARSDVFSFGVMLYEMLTGRRPFVAQSTVALLIAIDRDPPPRISNLSPRAPRALERLVERCLAKKPDQRFPNCEALLGALDGAAQVRRTPRRRWLALSIAAVALVVLGAGAVARFAAAPSQHPVAEPLTSSTAPESAGPAHGEAGHAAAASTATEGLGSIGAASGSAHVAPTGGPATPASAAVDPVRAAPSPRARPTAPKAPSKHQPPAAAPTASAPPSPAPPARSSTSLQDKVVHKPPF